MLPNLQYFWWKIYDDSLQLIKVSQGVKNTSYFTHFPFSLLGILSYYAMYWKYLIPPVIGAHGACFSGIKKHLFPFHYWGFKLLFYVLEIPNTTSYCAHGACFSGIKNLNCSMWRSVQCNFC